MAGENTGVIQATAADRIRAFGVSSGKTKLMTDSMVGNTGRKKSHGGSHSDSRNDVLTSVFSPFFFPTAAHAASICQRLCGMRLTCSHPTPDPEQCEDADAHIYRVCRMFGQ
jgi:hypothetical protein